MKPWAWADPLEYRELNLRAHAILDGVPLQDTWRVDLPGGGEDRTIEDIRTLAEGQRQGPVVRALFELRWALGRLLRWDVVDESEEGLFKHRLTEADHAASTVESGTKDGPFTILYVHPNEALSEIRNATVHAALVYALVKREGGYRLWWGIYVAPTGRLTRFYMTLIGPFRRWIVYPNILGGLHRAWCEAYGGGSQSP